MIDWLTGHWHYIFWGVVLSYCVWHGFKIEITIDKDTYFLYEVYPLKRFF